MRKAQIDPQILDHLEWLGFVRPTGLVVSAPALAEAGAILNKRDIEGQERLKGIVTERIFDPKRGPEPAVSDFRELAKCVLGWSFSPKGYAGTGETLIPSELEVAILDAGETLRPDYAVRERDPKDGATPWQLLVQVLDLGQDFDRALSSKGHLELSPQGRMERLVRQTGVGAGLLFNGRAVRLISAPRGESSGWLDFSISDMVSTAGRPILSALRLLLGESRLLALPKEKRLAALLEDSRKFQNKVSERLSEQVLHALYEMLRGFQAAHDASKANLLKDVLEGDPDQVYRALLSVILRIVFLLFAEERDMMPEDETFLRYYSLGGLHERLREDAALYPDTMDQRFGAWAQLIVLFRMVFDGAEYGGIRLPQRHGDLFDPDRFPFLEGRSTRADQFSVPLVPDGTIYRALEKLLVLDGERLSYRALDVEQIGSVYETMMGFRIETATGRSVAIRAEKRHGAPTTVDLEALLREPGAKREKWLQENAGRKMTDNVKKAVKEATTLEDLHVALLKVTDKAATPDWVSKGSLVLQPSEERRRSGSHYTPRSLTEPIVRTTLEPILTRLRGETGRPPLPEQILGLKVCDPAMGSGAFLVETCRQLADALIESWRFHGGMPALPPDEDEVVFARRMVAQRCLYGVDRNPMAVDLAKVSLWLVTLAKDHSFTFLDHALRNGDSLVGLSNQEILAVHWDAAAPKSLFDDTLPDRIRQSATVRQKIAAAQEENYEDLSEQLKNASAYINDLRLIGDSVIAAFFSAERPKDRLTARYEVMEQTLGLFKAHERHSQQPFRDQLVSWSDHLGKGVHPVSPFHWELEFPEVFLRANRGFDAVVGNPPFLGGTKISSANSTTYLAWLNNSFIGSEGKSDLVAYFFRLAFDLCRSAGTIELLATNSIRQGDTRSTGLTWIREHGGQIFHVVKRLKWPGSAVVVVSVVGIMKGTLTVVRYLDNRRVPHISSYLLAFGPDGSPVKLNANSSTAFSGVNPNGKGFLVDRKERDQFVEESTTNLEVLRPFLGSVEMNEGPTAAPTRYIIDFTGKSDKAVETFAGPFQHLYDTVRIQRQTSNEVRLREKWWLFSRPADVLTKALQKFSRVIVNGRHSVYITFTFQPASIVFSDAVTVFLLDSFAAFAVLQSTTHELWAAFQGSSIKDDPRYIPEDCFETFPFPMPCDSYSGLELVGQVYYEFRADLMVRYNEGLTKTYNRFHDPEERSPDIHKLRELHAAMDRAVLDAYGWTDISTDCEFILDYEEDEDDAGSRRKKPWRYRWPDDVRDEVLARLLELNSHRAAEEERAGKLEASKGKTKARRTSSSQTSLPGLSE